jgi:hypothetical protein
MLHAAPPVMPSPHDVNTLVHSLTTRLFDEKEEADHINYT